MPTGTAPDLDHANIDNVAVRFTDAAGVPPNIAAVLTGHATPSGNPVQPSPRRRGTRTPSRRTSNRRAPSRDYLAKRQRKQASSE
jgi:hypothetical protein